jgi:hypothetical protein
MLTHHRALVLILALSSWTATASAQPNPAPWRNLFDGQSLQGWTSANFGGEGDVRVENGAIQLERGVALTGITRAGTVPRIDYEVQLEAMRVDGIDFFCGLTFPVDQSHCSLIVGGWAGSVVGLSSIDGQDASENETTRYMNFETGRWYRIRLQVTQQAIAAWIDDQQVVNQPIAGRTISIRPEVNLSRPLGIAAWQTRAALRNIQLRELQKKE